MSDKGKRWKQMPNQRADWLLKRTIIIAIVLVVFMQFNSRENQKTLHHDSDTAALLIDEQQLQLLVKQHYNRSFTMNGFNLLRPGQVKDLLAHQGKGLGGKHLLVNLPVERPLRTNRKTLFVITPTYQNEKRTTRASTLRRHMASLEIAIASSQHFFAGDDNINGHDARNADAQILWIVIEDGPRLDKELVKIFRDAPIPVIYFAYGPMHNFGNPQRNAALSLVYDLTTNYPSTNGPVYFLDDDSLVLPILFESLLLLPPNKVMTFPVGNLGTDGFERPIMDKNTGRILFFRANGLYRGFPIDMGAFTFDSELLGRKFPRYQYMTRVGARNEDAFLSQMVDAWEELEVLCNDCWMFWHNENLKDMDMLYPFS